MAKNKSSNPTANSIDLKAKAEKWHRIISTAKNIYAPENTKLKKEIIDDITNSFDGDILRYIKETIDIFPCLLIIGNKDESLLLACYAHCIRDIEYRDFIRTYEQHLEKQDEYNRPNVYLPDIDNYTFFECVPCFGENLSLFGEDVKKWMDLFSCGYTVFLYRLKLESEDEYERKCFIRSLEASRLNMPIDSSGLFIISIDSESDLPEYFIEQFKPVDGKETVAKPSETTIESEERQDEKVEPAEENINQKRTEEKPPKASEYLRLGEHPDSSFYAKVKGVEKEEKLKLSEGAQEYKVLEYLYNIYGTEHNKASVEDLLIAGNIQNHEKGEEITKEKIKHLGRAISDIRTEFKKAGWKRGRLKDDGYKPKGKLYYLLIPTK